jgi:hypothetical protein
VAYKKRPMRGSASFRPEERSPKAPLMVVGEDLEYRVARLLQFMGFFVRRGCPIYTVGVLDRATDLDVFAIKYIEPFSRELIIAECKSGDVGPLDRIFWLSGVRQFSKANRAMLVRKGTKWNIKDFAKECGVEILDLQRVTELEAAFKISGSEWPAQSDRAFFESSVPGWNDLLKRHPELWELQITLSSEIRYDDPFPSINFLLYQLRLLTRSWKTNSSSSLHRYLLSEAISQLSLFFMRLAEKTFDLSEADRIGYIEKGLKYGNVDPKFAERMMNSAFNLTRQAILHYTRQVQDIDRKVFEVPLPPGTKEVLSTIELILRSYPRSLSLPQICDLLLFEVFVKENRNKGWLKRIYPQHDLSARVDVARDYLGLLAQSGACPPEIIQALSSTGIDNGKAAETHAHAEDVARPQEIPRQLALENTTPPSTLPPESPAKAVEGPPPSEQTAEEASSLHGDHSGEASKTVS